MLVYGRVIVWSEVAKVLFSQNDFFVGTCFLRKVTFCDDSGATSNIDFTLQLNTDCATLHNSCKKAGMQKLLSCSNIFILWPAWLFQDVSGTGE